MDGWVTIGTKLDTKDFDKQIKEVESKLNDLEATLQMASEDKTLFSTTEIREMEAEAEKLRNKLVDLRKKQADLNKVDLSNITKSMSNIIKKAVKWGLAIFSLRSAYSFIRQSISTISQYNEQFATDLEYIRYALASSLQPVIERIVKLVQLLLTYINYIWKAWFGKELFASAKSFENMKKSSGGVAKNVKEIKKQLAGFDEMNILNEDGSVSAGGGGISVPSIDLTDWNNITIPKWIQWIADNKDIVLGFLKGVAAGLIAIKIAKFAADLSKVLKFCKGLSALKLTVLIAGIVTALTGVVRLVEGLIDFIKNPSWENFNKILEGLTLTLLGVGAAMIALNTTNPVGWIVLATGSVVGLVAACSKWAKGLFEDKANILSTKEAQEKLTEAINNAKKATDEYVDAVDNAEDAQKKLTEAEKKNKISGEELYKAVQDGTLDYKDMNNAQREVYKAYLNNKTAQENLKTATDNLTTAKQEEKDASWEAQLATAEESKSYDNLKTSIIEAFDQGELSASEARDYIERAMAGMSSASRKAFLEDLPEDIKKGLDPSRYESTWSKFKRWWDDNIGKLTRNITLTIKGNFSATTGTSGGGGGGGGFAKGGVTGFANGGVNVIKMASGSIISQPGRGVPMSRAIGGEAGREGIIPLTNAEMMSELGRSIGEWVTINLTNITKMDSRQIAREQKIINAQSDFAANR